MPSTYPIQQRAQLLDALWFYQDKYGFIPNDAVTDLARQLAVARVEIEGVLSFYHFFRDRYCGKHQIYLNKSILSEFAGFSKIREAFETAIGARLGEVDPTGTFGLFETACIGLSDQEPAALIDLYPFVKLTPQKVHRIIQQLKAGQSPADICDQPATNLHYFPADDRAIFFRNYTPGRALKRALSLGSDGVLDELKKAKLLGMGGAFFPVYHKWLHCREQQTAVKYIICNADEGEPGTFKDRVLMQTLPGLMLEGMLLAGYVTGAKKGFIYLRAEYRYLLQRLTEEIEAFRKAGLLGQDINGLPGFDFDIAIQLGAGAYVCGEETALMQSMEGMRGEPRPKRYFPTEKGLFQQPTVVNNVETFMAASRIIELGARQVLQNGTATSPGNKVLSVAGDCDAPGIYEIEWGMTLRELLDRSGTRNTAAIQLSGPSGELVPVSFADRRIAPDELRCGGSVMIFSQERDLLQILRNYNTFFMEESCGICTPCRGGNYILKHQLQRLQQGLADRSDLVHLHDWAAMMRSASRCGLGKTAANALIQAIERFPDYFAGITLADDVQQLRPFDMEGATTAYDQITKKHR